MATYGTGFTLTTDGSLMSEKAVLLSFSVLQPGWKLMQQQYVKP
jgi:hypothetical protein